MNSATERPAAQARVVELDALRGIAAFGVMMFHFVGVHGDVYGHDFEALGWVGHLFFSMHLFFMVSGFVILASLERCRGALDFIVGRASRLLPTYWVAVLVTGTLVTAGALPGRQVSIRDWLINATMFQRFLNVEDLDGAYWSLAVELAFYFLALCVFLIRGLPRVERFAAAWLVLQLAYRAAEAGLGFQLGARLEVLFAMDWAHLFVAGIAFYRIHGAGPTWGRAALALSAVPIQALFGDAIGVAVIAAYEALFFAIVLGRLRFVGARPLVFLGSISYAVYVLHQQPGFAAMRAMREAGLASWAGILIAVLLTLAAATVVTRWIEEPAIRALRGAWKRRRPVASAAASPAPIPDREGMAPPAELSAGP